MFRLLLLLPLLLISCSEKKTSDTPQSSAAVPVVGIVQPFEDATVDQARLGFIDALKSAGYDEAKGTVKILYRNSQGDAAALNQIIDYMLGEKVTLLATNTTVATIAAAGRTREVPIFMMVAPSPEIAGLARPGTPAPANLLGTYETLEYIDTSVTLIRTLVPTAKRVGTIYNSSEPNSANALARLRTMCTKLGLELVEIPVTATSEAQSAAQAMAARDVDVFFALPDNIMFGAFETVVRSMNDAKVPIITSEAGLVTRGAVAAYGADFRAWGRQAGEAAARFLKSGKSDSSMLELVRLRRRVVNPDAAARFAITPPPGFEPLRPAAPEVK